MPYPTQNSQGLDLKTLFPFELDDFQKQAIAALNAGKSVVVCAPTGSGKTLIGEYAIYRALSRSKRVFYTTPLKALSNQKFRDFRQQFGTDFVGLLTGDISVNRDAPIVVMTTEIFRNMLYGTPIGEVGTSLVGVEAVVLDECHYMNDRQRGTVWEESIIYCPTEIQLVALSATVANSEQLTDWIDRVHGPTELIYSDYRPVPLQFHFCNPKGLFPLLSDGQTHVNGRLLPKKNRGGKPQRSNRYTSQQEGRSLAEAIRHLQQQDQLPAIYFILSRRDCERAATDEELAKVSLLSRREASELKILIDQFLDRNPKLEQIKYIRNLIEPLYRGVSTYHAELIPAWRSFVGDLFQQGLVKVLFVPETIYICGQLQQDDMLPAIYFIFSRSGCDRAVAECDFAASELGIFSLITPEEAAQLKSQIDDFLTRNPEAGRSGQIEPLYRGIAAHHAGILPAWKGLVEELFQQGLIKVVFATETLAAGINMPARTTVISSLSKRTDDGHRLLRPSEFLQMAGRAGRRGMDELGHVVTVQTPFEGAKEAAYLATAKPDPLASQFTPSYGMVLNLLQTHTIEEAKELVERSFGQYLSTLYLRPKQEKIEQLRAERIVLERELGISTESAASLEMVLASYEKLQGHLKEEKRLLRTLQQQAEDALTRDMAAAVAFAVLGTVLSLRGKHVPTAKRPESPPLPAVLVSKVPGSGQAPLLVCLGKDNRWYVIAAGDVAALHAELPRLSVVDYLEPPAEMPRKLGQCRKGDEVTAAIAQQIPDRPAPSLAPELLEQQQRVTAVEAEIENHRIHEWGNPSKLIKRQRRLEELDREIQEYQAELDKRSAHYWEEFLNLILVLQSFGGLEELEPTILGQACAAIRGDNELWLGMALMSGEFEALDPHNLAAACAALVTEISRPDSWTNYNLSDEVQMALGRLRILRSKLIKVQSDHSVHILTLPDKWEDRRLSALVEQWALGVEWRALVENTSLDEGDVVRILRRTLDFLSQIPHVPHVSQTLRNNAYRAIQLIDRFPINEGAD